jgi:phage gp16-like protein
MFKIKKNVFIKKLQVAHIERPIWLEKNKNSDFEVPTLDTLNQWIKIGKVWQKTFEFCLYFPILKICKTLEKENIKR